MKAIVKQFVQDESSVPWTAVLSIFHQPSCARSVMLFVILSISIITYFATNLIVVENVFEVQLVSMAMLFDCSSLRWSASRLAAI
jgi:hypothetical protein